MGLTLNALKKLAGNGDFAPKEDVVDISNDAQIAAEDSAALDDRENADQAESNLETVDSESVIGDELGSNHPSQTEEREHDSSPVDPIDELLFQQLDTDQVEADHIEPICIDSTENEPSVLPSHGSYQTGEHTVETRSGTFPSIELPDVDADNLAIDQDEESSVERDEPESFECDAPADVIAAIDNLQPYLEPDASLKEFAPLTDEPSEKESDSGSVATEDSEPIDEPDRSEPEEIEEDFNIPATDELVDSIQDLMQAYDPQLEHDPDNLIEEPRDLDDSDSHIDGESVLAADTLRALELEQIDAMQIEDSHEPFGDVDALSQPVQIDANQNELPARVVVDEAHSEDQIEEAKPEPDSASLLLDENEIPESRADCEPELTEAIAENSSDDEADDATTLEVAEAEAEKTDDSEAEAEYEQQSLDSDLSETPDEYTPDPFFNPVIAVLELDDATGQTEFDNASVGTMVLQHHRAQAATTREQATPKISDFAEDSSLSFFNVESLQTAGDEQAADDEPADPVKPSPLLTSESDSIVNPCIADELDLRQITQPIEDLQRDVIDRQATDPDNSVALDDSVKVGNKNVGEEHRLTSEDRAISTDQATTVATESDVQLPQEGSAQSAENVPVATAAQAILSPSVEHTQQVEVAQPVADANQAPTQMPVPSELERRILERLTNAEYELPFAKIVEAIRNGSKCKTLIVSVRPTPLTSVLAGHLAILLASSHKESVVLVDADADQRGLSSKFDLNDSSGFTESMDEMVEGVERLQRTSLLRLQLLPYGNAKDAKPNSNVKQNLLAKIGKQTNAHVLVDAGSVDSLWSQTLCDSVDSVILLAEADADKMKAIKRAAEAIRKRGANLVGCVMTGEFCDA